MEQAGTRGDGPATFEGMEGRASVDTVLRTTQQALSELSAQADLKANIIITASALLLTVSITRIGDDNLRVGTIILSLGCAVTLVLAILAVLPTATMRRVVHKDGNPIYFMEAAAMDRQEFHRQLAVRVPGRRRALHDGRRRHPRRSPGSSPTASTAGWAGPTWRSSSAWWPPPPTRRWSS